MSKAIQALKDALGAYSQAVQDEWEHARNTDLPKIQEYRMGLAEILKWQGERLIRAEYRAAQVCTITGNLRVLDSAAEMLANINSVDRNRRDAFIESEGDGMGSGLFDRAIKACQRLAEARLIERDIPRMRGIIEKHMEVKS